ncbi:ATP-dependent DNA helicase PIF4-like [Telopea speciosissima]|uniref:ATP-dependent DNA helicase PIF4-like n=1 Tax=Telopea speciosissima TaxID=54955 RepID=UPI001CC7BCD9|nr:ATP-dependent DNA helicase PIF4-like [Telopea speciosissima]
MGKSTKDYDLPKIEENSIHLNESHPREIANEYSITVPVEDYEAQKKLNAEQYNAYIVILNHVNENQSGIFVVDGPGGMGKTYLYRTLLATIRSHNQIALATATSGVAAAIMPGGQTAHSRFKIPINLNDSSVCNISKQSATAELIRKAKLIIWDEAPMAKRQAIEVVDRTSQDITNNS